MKEIIIPWNGLTIFCVKQTLATISINKGQN